MYLGEKDFHYNVKGSFTMRKIVSLGLLALSLGYFTIPAVAGVASDCERIKDDNNRALYGLCIAYWNTTNAVAREKILGNFEKKDSESIGMPGLDEPNTTGFTECSCWLQVDHVQAILDDPDTTYDMGFCNDPFTDSEAVFFNSFDIQFIADADGCEFIHNPDGVAKSYGSLEAELTCRAQIHMLIEHFEAEADCTPEP
jgi:hypothetical protein